MSKEHTIIKMRQLLVEAESFTANDKNLLKLISGNLLIFYRKHHKLRQNFLKDKGHKQASVSRMERAEQPIPIDVIRDSWSNWFELEKTALKKMKSIIKMHQGISLAKKAYFSLAAYAVVASLHHHGYKKNIPEPGPQMLIGWGGQIAIANHQKNPGTWPNKFKSGWKHNE